MPLRPVVLLVDDEPLLRRVYRRSLSVDFHCIEVGDARAALAVSREVAVAVIDVGLPDMNGFTLARRLTHRHAGLSVVLVSGGDLAALATNAGIENTSRLLQKPFSSHRLLSEVRSCASGPVRLREAR